MKQPESNSEQPDADEPAMSPEQLALARKLDAFVNQESWRRCRRGLCRRLHACTPPDVFCIAPRPKRPEMTAEEEQQMLGRLNRELRRRLAESPRQP